MKISFLSDRPRRDYFTDVFTDGEHIEHVLLISSAPRHVDPSFVFYGNIVHDSDGTPLLILYKKKS